MERAPAELSGWLRTWKPLDLMRLWEFGQVLLHHRDNSTTPIEDALIVMTDMYGDTFIPDTPFEVTTDMLQGALDEAKPWFEDAIHISRFMNKRYPRTLARAAEETDTPDAA